MANFPLGFYIQFFLNKKVNVLLWNYRGYGLTNGDPCFGSLKSDAEAVFDYLQNNIGVRGKVGVYARSVGTVAACSLHSRADLLILDRGFDSIQDLVSQIYKGKITKCLFSIFSDASDTSNAFDFLFPTSLSPSTPDNFSPFKNKVKIESMSI